MAVRSLAPGEEAAAAAALCEAFQREAFAHWVHPAETDRRAVMGAMFSDLIHTPPSGAKIDVTDGIGGVAVWLPPGKVVRSAPPLGARADVLQMFTLLDQAAPSQPFWYLMFLGARTPGAGIGTALLQQRAHCLPSALWTGSYANVGFYVSHGFRPISQLKVKDTSAWWLWKT